MQTYSHVIITAALNRVLKQKEGHDGALRLGRFPLPPLRSGATLLGSFMPDVPLTLTGILFIVVDLIQGNAAGFESDPLQSWTGWLFDYAFFQVWWVKLLHNLFHAPLLIFLFMAIGYLLNNRWQKTGQVGSNFEDFPNGEERIVIRQPQPDRSRSYNWGAALFWFAVSCLLHTAIDIPLHYDDGPLIFFPLDWQTRFYSPVSYWDPRRYGVPVAIFEHVLVLFLIGYLLLGWWHKRRQTLKGSIS